MLKYCLARVETQTQSTASRMKPAAKAADALTSQTVPKDISALAKLFLPKKKSF